MELRKKQKRKAQNQQNRQKTGSLFREARIDIRAAGEEDSNKVRLSFSSEEPYVRWFGPEILCHDAECVDLSRLNEIGVLLFNHDRDEVIGRIEKAWIENGRGEAEVVFDDDEASQRILAKVRSGTLKTTSVGYQVTNWEEVEQGAKSEDGRFQGPCSIAKRWMPFEISIVSVPADATVGVGRDLEDEQPEAVPDYSRYQAQIDINKNELEVMR